jgi:hypothetical protein
MPPTRLRTVTVSEGSTLPIARIWSGTDFWTTAATATGTGWGPAAGCCWPPREHAAPRSAQASTRRPARRMRGIMQLPNRHRARRGSRGARTARRAPGSGASRCGGGVRVGRPRTARRRTRQGVARRSGRLSRGSPELRSGRSSRPGRHPEVAASAGAAPPCPGLPRAPERSMATASAGSARRRPRSGRPARGRRPLPRLDLRRVAARLEDQLGVRDQPRWISSAPARPAGSACPHGRRGGVPDRIAAHGTGTRAGPRA